MISLGLDGFVELHGDRYFGDDAAVVGGIGWKDGRPVTVIAIERGTTTKERMRRNFGMAHPRGLPQGTSPDAPSREIWSAGSVPG